MIYTSYFSNWRNFPEDSYVIGVTRYPPEHIENWSQLAPSETLLRQYKNHQIDDFMFSVKYKEWLESIVNKRTYQKLLKELQTQYKNIILCCYETKQEFCHRHILADWLDMDIKEL